MPESAPSQHPERQQYQQHRQEIPCPSDLELSAEQRATLETAMIPGWAIDEITLKLRAKHAGGEARRTLDEWRRGVVSAVVADWNNPRRRPKREREDGKPPGLVEHEQQLSERDKRHIARLVAEGNKNLEANNG